MTFLKKKSKIFFLALIVNFFLTISTYAHIDAEASGLDFEKAYPGKLKARFRNRKLIRSFKGGYSEEKIIAIPKNTRPPVEKYLRKKYIRQHGRQFYHRGAAFIVVKSWLEIGSFEKFPPRKYCMLKSDMNHLLKEYRKSHDVSVIENALGYTPGTLKSLEDELYVFYIDHQNYKFQIPDGTEIGANNLWEPGGLTSGKCKEAVMINKAGADITIVFDKQLSNLQKQLKWQKVRLY